MKSFLAAAVGVALAAAAPAGAKSVTIDVDSSLAKRMLELACSGAAVRREELATSPLVRAQLEHHRPFGDQYTIDRYLAGVEAIARCEKPSPDPFRFGSFIDKRAAMAKAINLLSASGPAIGKAAASMIAPYVPAAMTFRGSVILAPASFSCGGFARGAYFFIDIPCIADNVEGEKEAITKLIAHETYHAVQDRLAGPPASIRDEDPRRLLMRSLAMEGSASFVADMTEIEGDGNFARFSRRESREGRDRLKTTASLLDFGMELLSAPGNQSEERFERLRTLIFGGQIGQPGYYLGQYMAAEIVGRFGAAALPCLLQLPSENFVLAYHRAWTKGPRLRTSVALGTETVQAAEQLAAGADRSRLERCLGPVA